MSLICGALKWLKDNDERDKSEAEKILTGQQQRYIYVTSFNKTSSNNFNVFYSCLKSYKQGESCQKGIQFI